MRLSRKIVPVFATVLFSSSLALAEWSPVTFTNESLREKGTLTGDGCQWVRGIAVAESDPSFMLWCTDVGGLFRSLDGGANWEPANVGFNPRGSAGVAVDPHNADRVLIVGANSIPVNHNGLYLSTDRAASWKQVLPVVMSSASDHRRQVIFDPSSFDAEFGGSRVAYWSRIGEDKANEGWGKTVNEPGFYRSRDGGETWALVPGGEVAADSHLAVHPKNGYIYAANTRGLWRSTDGGDSWTQVLEGAIAGIAVSPAAPDRVWICRPDGILRSDDAGLTFAMLPGSAQLARPDSLLRGIVVAPSDADRIALWRLSPNWSWPRFVSHDGGATWIESEIKPDHVLVPTNSRDGYIAFDSRNPDIILSTGGDYPTISRDGGRTFALAGNGVNNVFIAGAFNFSAINPDIVFLGSQDYATFLTTDGGHNWAYLEPGQRGWGGFNYGAYSTDGRVLLVGESQTWGSPKMRTLSMDAGKTWTISNQPIKPLRTYGDPRDAAVLFAGDQRSADSGATWSLMDGVNIVHIHDPVTGELYGTLGTDKTSTTVKRSGDSGATWETLFTVDGVVADLAVDSAGGRIYLVNDARLRVWESATGTIHPIDTVIHDQGGYPRVLAVAIDPVDPRIVYIAGNRDVFASNASAQRSLDGGKTWENLTRQIPLDGVGRDGGREAQWVRVNAKTREAWFTTGCYGVWKHSAPAPR
ncbi:MAG: hypothetical protein ACFCU4_08820 [Puniceicoccaceae bacterium]